MDFYKESQDLSELNLFYSKNSTSVNLYQSSFARLSAIGCWKEEHTIMLESFQLIRQCKEELNRLEQSSDIILTWIDAQRDYFEKEQADQ